LLGRLLGDIETIVTTNEKEALLVEDTLVKQHRPRFNVKLRDDKNYLVLRLDPRARYPRLELQRRIREDGARYFGPYYPARAARATLKAANKHFGLRSCTDRMLTSRTRPCLQFQIGWCPAPCVQEVADYADRVRDVTLFLEGRSAELTQRLQTRMQAAAAAEEFERAAALRDRLAAVEVALTQQRVVAATLVDQDVVGYHREGDVVEVAFLRVRQGRLTGQQRFSFAGQEFPDDEILSSFLSLYYHREGTVPDEVLLPLPFEGAAALAEWLAERAGHRVEVLCPQRGPRHDLVGLANTNARAFFATCRDPAVDAQEALAKLQRRLRLSRLPRRIECFDISTMQGVATVGSRVVLVDGQPAKNQYRRFQVRTVNEHADDYAALYEVLSRRLRRARDAREGDPWALPDLLVVDGGKGQLSTALMALRDAGLELGKIEMDLIGLAKEVHEAPAGAAPGTARDLPDRVYLPRVKDPLQLRPGSAELLLLRRVRDESHRFAIAYHRKLRGRRALRSALAEIPGVGPKRRRELLRHFGSVRALRAATRDEIAAAPGMSRPAAEAVFNFLRAVGNARE
ncbi:MAG: excinuclease ABC subunit UvrC, partial [Deltaproteobacteria bacterium]|nr:excinuclease ABC subunit UvrC [Deltaproteobacteria bacterium]